MTGPPIPAELVCPRDGGVLSFTAPRVVCTTCGPVGRFEGGVWDFADETTYADSFGDQWTRHRRAQLDSANGTTISRRRFEDVTGWDDEQLAGKRVLDAGCGAGRFTEIALEKGASVTAIDLSAAAYVVHESLSARFGDRLTVVRGSILEPPLADASFDYVFSIGVLQHTPDPLAATRRLLRLTRPGGELALWAYERRWYTRLQPGKLLRPITTRMSTTATRRLASVLVAVFTPVVRVVARLPPRPRRGIKWLIPIASYWGELPLAPQQQREWSMLDTVDWLTPAHDHPQRVTDLEHVLHESGAARIDRRPVPGVTLVAAAAPRP